MSLAVSLFSFTFAARMDEAQLKAIRRRRFILHRLEKYGEFTYKDLKEQSLKSAHDGGEFPHSPQSIRDDVDHLQQLLRMKISNVARGRETIYFSGSRPKATTSAKEARASFQADAKLAMASVAGTLILGSQEGDSYSIGDPSVYEWKKNLESPSHILDCLEGHPSIAWKLRKFWSSITRRVAVDTGTSIDAICERVIQHVTLPSPDTILNQLEVCTNSRSVFSLLGRPDVNTRTIVVGGAQEPRTECICDRLAENFLDNSGLNFGIAFVGATVVDLQEDRFGSDHQRISTMKAKMLGRSVLRVVLADSEKFTDEPLRAYDAYSKISPDSVDIIITEQNLQHSDTERQRLWNKLKSTGIAIVYASDKMLTLARHQIEQRRKREEQTETAIIGSNPH
jgi:DeoR/GlpR family transcriptional regulator of sugar metabolism